MTMHGVQIWCILCLHFVTYGDLDLRPENMII